MRRIREEVAMDLIPVLVGLDSEGRVCDSDRGVGILSCPLVVHGDEDSVRSF